MTTQTASLRLADRLADHPYTMPGCYPLFAVMDDGGALCPHCARSERKWIGTTTGTDGWCIKALEINWEDDALYCDHCSSRIESAYAG